LAAASNRGRRLAASFRHPFLIFKAETINWCWSWTNVSFTLQSAPSVTGPFTNLPAATSPFTNPITAPQQFFRLISN
jgi:hypothetical protein